MCSPTLFDDPELTWRLWVSESRQLSSWARRALARRIGGFAGSCSLPTPTQADGKRGSSNYQGGNPTLLRALLPTPTSSDSVGSTSGQHSCLRRTVRGMLPTPAAQSYGRNKGGANPDGPERESLETMARRGRLPTPTVGDANSSGSAGYSTESGRHSGMTLTDALVRFPNEAVAGGTGRLLSPRFVEWMMGVPIGWTGSELSATEWSRWSSLMRGAFCAGGCER